MANALVDSSVIHRFFVYLEGLKKRVSLPSDRSSKARIEIKRDEAFHPPLLLRRLKIGKALASAFFLVKMMNNSTLLSNETSYHVSPDVLPEVYIAAACFMVFICCFGVTSNISVVILFCNSPLVSVSTFAFVFALPIFFSKKLTKAKQTDFFCQFKGLCFKSSILFAREKKLLRVFPSI